MPSPVSSSSELYLLLPLAYSSVLQSAPTELHDTSSSTPSSPPSDLLQAIYTLAFAGHLRTDDILRLKVADVQWGLDSHGKPSLPIYPPFRRTNPTGGKQSEIFVVFT